MAEISQNADSSPSPAPPHLPPSSPSPPILRLPPELRNAIYEIVVQDDLVRFAQCFRMPTLLRASKQLRAEYMGVFFSTDNLTLSVFYPDTSAWQPITSVWDKYRIVERCLFKHLVSYSSLASAQRYCERRCFDRPGARRGILTVRCSEARWWQWQMWDE